MKRTTLLLLTFAFIFVSCDDDFSINDKWQDITIVYGLLNNTDTAQYIKINKAFLGEGDVYQMAAVSDSIQYSANLDVKLIEYKIIDTELDPYFTTSWERTDREPIILYKTNEIPKKEGVFGNDVNYLYKTTETLYDRYKYVIEIVNPETNKKVSSETYMIYNLKVVSPNIDVRFKVDMSNERHTFATSWKSAVYGKIYQVQLCFNYLEIINNDTIKKSVYFKYPEQKNSVVTLPGRQGSEMQQPVGGVDFYQKIASNVDKKDNVKRIFSGIDFIYDIGGQSFTTFLSVSNAVGSYGQIPAAYTNIKNGKGIFDCRKSYKIQRKMITNASLDSLSRGRFTKHLGFVNWTLDQ
jgi:hypothetical protein